MATLEPVSSTKQRDAALAFGAFLVAVLLWQLQGATVLTYPLRLFVTMVHEMAHGLAALATGGSFLRFEVTRYGAGMAYTSGGSRFLIIQAGYLGTALFGAVLLILANRVRRPGSVAIGLGAIIALFTLLYSGLGPQSISPVESVVVAAALLAGFYLILTRQTNDGRYLGVSVVVLGGVLFAAFAGWDNLLTGVVGLGSAAVLFIIGTRAGRSVNLVALNFLAFLTGLQAITDGWVLLRIVSLPRSMMPLNDAASMAGAYGGSAMLWALYWIALDIVIFGSAIYLVFIRPRRRAVEGVSGVSRPRT